jgi:hypothetical protein
MSRTPLLPLIKRAMRAGVRADVDRRRQLAVTLVASARESQLSEELERNGYCVVSDAVDGELLRRVSDAAAAKYRRGKTEVLEQEATHKDFWTRLLDEDKVDGTLPSDNPFVAFALQPAVVSILAKTYGEIPYLDYVLLLLSESTGKELSQSQLWHRDYDDIRTIKLYIYLTDVLEIEDGPFTFLPGPVSDRFGFALRSRRPDAAIEAKLRPGEMKVMRAPRLSVFMVETSRCLHMGSRVAPGHDRLMYMATYISVPRVYPEPPPRFRLIGAESEVIRHVLLPPGSA